MTGPDAIARPRAYCLAMLTALSAMNQLDRQLMSVVLEPVRREFGASDIQLGLLSGLAFAALYTTLSIPAAIWAVQHSRRDLVAAAALLWGVMTALCGAVQSFGQLFLARLGVGIGEAGGSAPAHAMISDLYGPGERATAMAIWSAGINAGIFLAFLFGGVIAERFGWRMAFVTAGVVTMLFAIVMRIGVREPARAVEARPGAVDAGAGVAGERWRAAATGASRLMWRDPVLRNVCIGAVLTTTVGYGALAWIPSYLVRSHHMATGAIGGYLALSVGIGGALGSWLCGRASDAFRRRDIRWSLWLVAALFIGAKPFSLAFYLSDGTALALTLFVIPAAIGAVFMGPSIAALHDRVPATRRPVVSAIYLLLVNFVGLGLGPLLTGALSQIVFAQQGEDSLRYGLATMQALGIWGGLHYWQAGRHLGAQRR